MDACRLVLVLGLLAAVAPLAFAELSADFYKDSCPDAEKIIATVIEKNLKADPGTTAGLLRLLFHDCFANGCDASILIDPLSNQSSEKEAGPNISVRGFEIIDEAKKELEAKCPNVVSCADIISLGTRDAVRLSGGPDYAVTTGRRDSLVSNREEADDNLPGPDIPVPKLIADFVKSGFTAEEMVLLLAGGHSIGKVRCIFIEPDATPMEPGYHASISKLCDGPNRDTGFVNMDQSNPNVVDNSYFANAIAEKMPLTIDRLLAIDSKTGPMLKDMLNKPTDFLPAFGKVMEKLTTLKVITGKDGEIRKTCTEFNNPMTSDGPSVIRISSVDPEDLDGLSAGNKQEQVSSIVSQGTKEKDAQQAVPDDKAAGATKAHHKKASGRHIKLRGANPE
ncbi:Peroxidase 44 [Hordeum vulgare]|uniref:Peroxidase n=1 Tax=Hordeum vulgare subsp. vulgare TaxID=112509 RepID=A0A8I6XND4_HORVV|nr:peroxidase 44-like [Hordeum vulgare subsp. vulgare]KAE8786787.1 Peroxidase 44 [Hordeum vulgare]